MAYRQQVELLIGLVLVATLGGTVGQFVGTDFPTTASSMTTQSQRSPLRTDDMLLAGSNATSSDDDWSSGKKKDGGKSGRDDGSALDGSGETSGSDGWSQAFGSSSGHMEYECDCRMVRRVSLMGASDYCLAPSAALSSKCGNVELGDMGACPLTGAQPCSSKGHVLANDSLCLLDEKDETYKCVASENDLEIQKNGKKKKGKSSRRPEAGTERNGASTCVSLSHVVVVVCLVAGVMAVV
ncbi:hypothetical protein PsorP6_017496 [Peronosclerospora sorghi]|uniref:Uncharacterized protein n=1 Tax=Peronosclerospora sorghi TaxID=230839 RepID=A0ACC0WM98_9STRA|nr:hypothetical protein PsorP6_017496 [Peronosclerospora sorghi]